METLCTPNALMCAELVLIKSLPAVVAGWLHVSMDTFQYPMELTFCYLYY